jgi:hypothetical protein
MDFWRQVSVLRGKVEKPDETGGIFHAVEPG